ncbi:MAG: asparaginase [Candidatus Cloacimonetes bacterium HGW-Cloacimonetes-1]|jgi:L-asparaginase II|nr:MAG: asparaginase [Candidatus Cloacimonetes bacterium HGW-Cloacimonetes-1]
MSEQLINVYRGNVVECIHRGDVAVVTPDAKLVAKIGDPFKYTYFRSSAKPLQAIEVFLSGAAERFGFSDAEISIMCASHYAEDFHINTVKSILHKIGIDSSFLLCGATRSINSVMAFQQAARGVQPQSILSDCSGKHSGVLASCLALGESSESYIDPLHPVQKAILGIIADICDYPRENIAIGIDGCSVPVFALPIYQMALGFARFANPQYLQDRYQEPADRIFGAMNNHPEMVSGTGGFCTALIRATGGRMIGKIGAQGVYTIGIRDPQIGIALKIEDGAVGTASVAAMHVLQELKLLTDAEYGQLSAFHYKPSNNDAGLTVGKICPEFTLEVI